MGLPLTNQNEMLHSSDTITPAELSETEKCARIQLYRSENIGPITFYQLLHRYKTAVEALNILPELARRGGRASLLRICPPTKVLQELERHQKNGAHLVVWGEPLYPKNLCSIPDASPVLSIKGNPTLFEHKSIAIVGARNCSLIGKKLATTYAHELGERGYIITSGLARGIDTAAHQGAIATGTVAVIAGGIDQIYPAENKSLFEQLSEQGLIVAEAPYGTEPQATLFPRRNRLISGLSLGVIIIEAAFQSGSLITARYANEQGKEVFVVPGSPLDPRYKGSNHLLKQGANLITSSHDVLGILEKPYKVPVNQEETHEISETNENEEKINSELNDIVLSLLSASAIPLDELIRACRVSSIQLQGTILQLELAGKVIRHPGNSISLAP